MGKDEKLQNIPPHSIAEAVVPTDVKDAGISQTYADGAQPPLRRKY